MALGTVVLLIAFVDELVLELRGARAPPRRTRRARAHRVHVDALITALLIVALFAILGSGVWIGLALSGVAWIGMELFCRRPAGDAMAVTIWGSASSWTLTALPLFVWMGEILFRTRLSRGHVPRPGAVAAARCRDACCTPTSSAARSSPRCRDRSAATCATIGKMTLPELKARGYPEGIAVGTLAGAGTLGLLIPPSIIMIVYGVAADVSIAKLFVAGVIPGILLAVLFSGYIASGRCATRTTAQQHLHRRRLRERCLHSQEQHHRLHGRR